MSRGPLSRMAIATSLAGAVTLASHVVRADNLDDIGVHLLQSASVQPQLTGTGIIVGIAESSTYDAKGEVSFNDFEAALFGDITAPITYVNASGASADGFPNNVGSYSGHASIVAGVFTAAIGATPGVAPNVTRIYNYEALFYVNHVVVNAGDFTADPAMKVVNQSFVLDTETKYDLANQVYDNYVNRTGVIVVSAIGNGPGTDMTQVQIPATAYNVISVGAMGINVGSTGTPDGRTKVDLTSPGEFTSFSTPLVSGVATLLVQAGTLGLGGAGTQAAAMDPRTMKALLLTGATKTSTWSHTATNPLDTQVGAGIVNAYGSYRILTAGKYTPSSKGTISTAANTPHPAVTTGTHVGLTGWAFQNSIIPSNAASVITSSASTSGLHHYAIDVPATGLQYIFTATLAWNRGTDNDLSDTTWSKLNNLDLYLYSGVTPITASTSAIDNVEHLYYPTLSPGTYDLQVLKQGGSLGSAGVASNSETYALSWAISLVGDTNWDGVVDIVDLTNVGTHWNTAQRSVFNGDLNGDGFVDINDFNIVASHWQAGATTNVTLGMPALQSIVSSVPEPASLLLIGVGSATMLLRRGRRANRTA